MKGEIKVENIERMKAEIHENAVAHGWWEESRSFGEICSLIHSELSEALEEYRNGMPGVYVVGEFGITPITAEQWEEGEKPEGIDVELADAVIRIHANGSTNASVSGAETVCITKNNPYCPGTYAKSRALSDAVLTEFCKATGAKKRSVWETDTMTGLNWSQVPVTILEMGYMSNQNEDLTMATASYQKKMVLGTANGIDAYFSS